MDRLKAKLRDPLHRLQRGAQARWHARELTAVHDRTGAIRPDDVLLFACLRNEAVRVPAFLAHYRQLGVDHFLFVDNGSGDGFQALVEEQHDVSVWHTTASYRWANFGMHWLNALLRDHGPGHWCVTCDLDEFLVYPHHEHRKLAELGAFLQREGLQSLSGLMLDMYGSQPPHGTYYRSGADPFEVTPWFDAEGYEQQTGPLGEMVTRGGPRRRLLFQDDPASAPVLNKTPFVFWRPGYRYFLSMHQLVPSVLNRPHPEGFPAPTACLMHFKYFSTLEEKVSEELQRREHFADALEYRRYADGDLGARTFLSEGSIRFEDWRQLVRLGLMNQGRWF